MPRLPGLYLKLLRDLRGNRSQVAALLAAIVLGIGLFQNTYMGVENLAANYSLFYDNLHFADFTVRINPARDDLTHWVKGVPGVSEVAGRIVREVKIEQPHAEIPSVVGRIISLPSEQRSAINDVRVTSGRYFTGVGRREVLVEGNFARFHDYQPGDTIYVKTGGRRVPFRVSGIVTSPEYLYPIQSKEYLFPTPGTFGVLFMPRRQVEHLFDMSGMINEICVLTKPGQRPRVMAIVQSMMERYGSHEPITREEQPSNKLLLLDMEGLRGTAVVFPMFFLTAAALVVYSVLSRMVRLQRTQIGFLRASGLSRAAVAWHYCLYALVLGTVGGLIGTIAGQLLSGPFTALYLGVLHLPFRVYAPGLGVAAIAMSIAVGISLLSALVPALGAARLTPAEAMRPAPQHAGMRLTALLARVAWRMGFATKLAVRNLLRQGYRLLFTIIGIALGVALVVVSVASLDMTEYTIEYYFRSVRHYDAAVGFTGPVSDALVGQIRQWPEVVWSEGTFGIPVTLSYGNQVLDTVLSGVPNHSRVYQLQDQTGQAIEVSQPGIYPTRGAARRLGVNKGQTVRLDYALNSRDLNITVRAPVVAVVEQAFGMGIYAPVDYLYEVFGSRLSIPPGTINGVLVDTEPGTESALKRRAFDLPQTASVELIADVRGQLDRQMAAADIFTGVMVLFGMTLMLAVVYNTVSMNLLERRRELAALRSLGLSVREMITIVTLENLLAAGLGLVVGLPIGWFFSLLVARAFETDQYTIMLHIEWTTYLIAILAVVATAIISQLPGLYSLSRMDLAQAVKMTDT